MNDVFGGNAVCGLQGEGQKTAQFVVWTSAGGKEKKNKAKFRGNQRIAVSVAEPDWHEFRWAVHHDMQGERKELNMEKDWAVEKRLEVELRALKLPVWTESEIGCATHDCAQCFGLGHFLSSLVRRSSLRPRLCSLRWSGRLSRRRSLDA